MIPAWVCECAVKETQYEGMKEENPGNLYFGKHYKCSELFMGTSLTASPHPPHLDLLLGKGGREWELELTCLSYLLPPPRSLAPSAWETLEGKARELDIYLHGLTTLSFHTFILMYFGGQCNCLSPRSKRTEGLGCKHRQRASGQYSHLSSYRWVLLALSFQLKALGDWESTSPTPSALGPCESVPFKWAWPGWPPLWYLEHILWLTHESMWIFWEFQKTCTWGKCRSIPNSRQRGRAEILSPISQMSRMRP